jgi:hypothetical protein
MRVEGKTFQDSPEAHPFGVEDPRAVARLKYEQLVDCGGDHIGDHARFITGFGVECTSASLRNYDNPHSPS